MDIQERGEIVQAFLKILEIQNGNNNFIITKRKIIELFNEFFHKNPSVEKLEEIITKFITEE